MICPAPIRIFTRRCWLLFGGLQFNAIHRPSGDHVNPHIVPSKGPNGAGGPPLTGEIQVLFPFASAVTYATFVPSGEKEGEENRNRAPGNGFRVTTGRLSAGCPGVSRLRSA